MKKYLLFLWLGIFLFAEPASGWGDEFLEEGSLSGAGAMLIESPYRGVDDAVYPVPVLIFESKRFFADKTTAGYYLNDKSNPVLWAIIGSLRMQGYAAGDSSDLTGMQDRDWALDGGLRISWKSGIINTILEAVTDLSGTHEGQELRLTVDRELFEGFLTPKAGVKWQSERLEDYYYGVRANEARQGRVEYAPGDDLEWMIGVTIGLPLGEKWAVFGDIQCSFLGDEGGDSPIVGDDSLMRYALGAVYRF